MFDIILPVCLNKKKVPVRGTAQWLDTNETEHFFSRPQHWLADRKLPFDMNIYYTVNKFLSFGTRINKWFWDQPRFQGVCLPSPPPPPLG